MAARLRLNHQQEVRDKIQASQLVNRVNAIAMGEVEANPTQLNAALGLLRKVLPDLSNVQLSGDDENPVNVKHIGAREVLAKAVARE